MKKKMLNVRLDEKTDAKLKQYAEDHDLSRSSVVSDALAVYLHSKDADQAPFHLGSDLFGAGASQQGDLSSTYKIKLKKKLSEKHAH